MYKRPVTSFDDFLPPWFQVHIAIYKYISLYLPTPIAFLKTTEGKIHY